MPRRPVGRNTIGKKSERVRKRGEAVKHLEPGVVTQEEKKNAGHRKI